MINEPLGLSLFSINLSSEDGGSNSSQRPIGLKKAKLKKKMAECNNSFVDSMISSNEKIFNFLKDSASTRLRIMSCRNYVSKIRLKISPKKTRTK